MSPRGPRYCCACGELAALDLPVGDESHQPGLVVGPIGPDMHEEARAVRVLRWELESQSLGDSSTSTEVLDGPGDRLNLVRLVVCGVTLGAGGRHDVVARADVDDDLADRLATRVAHPHRKRRCGGRIDDCRTANRDSDLGPSRLALDLCRRRSSIRATRGRRQSHNGERCNQQRSMLTRHGSPLTSELVVGMCGPRRAQTGSALMLSNSYH